MKKLFLLLVFFSSVVFSQYNIDSLKQIAENEHRSKFERATAYFEISNIDDENLIEEYCNKSIEMLSLVGYYYRIKGLITKAFDKYFTALKYSEKTDNKALYADMKNNIGMLYYSQKQYRESIPYYYKAIEVYKLLKSDEYEARTYMNLAGAFQNSANFPSAIFNFKKALNMFIQQKDSFYIGFAYNNIAVCFKNNNLPDSAFNYLNRSLPYFQKLNSKDELAWTYDIMAGMYVSNKEYTKAEPYCKMCIEIAEERNLPDQLSSCLRSLFVISRERGDYKQALLYYMQSDSLKDSLINNNNRLLLAKTQVEYDFSKKEELLTI
jgi:tetratricopeptide (TPR) repeat protein